MSHLSHHDRRSFLRNQATLGATGWFLWQAAAQGLRASQDASREALVREFLSPYVLQPDVVNAFLDPKARVWAKFHPEYGYLLRNSFVRDGVDGSYTLARYESTGERHQVNFPDAPCRIHTYGDSFTQGHQVSDGETWQEILAAHFCEPIRNYGIGGFGVYQAYRRLLENESSNSDADHLIFNLWGDDQYRSLYAWRWLIFPPEAIRTMSGEIFHANPWDHVRIDHDTNQLIEVPNRCPTPESLLELCNLDRVVELFGDDEITHLLIAIRTGRVVDEARLDRLAATLGETVDWSHDQSVRSCSSRLLHQYATRVGVELLRKIKAVADQQQKKLLVLLSYPMGSVWHACNGTAPGDADNVDWHPSAIKNFLTEQQVPWIDTLPAHVAEYETFKLTAKEYVDRYYIGHYTPRGNHFFAYAIKDRIVEWLNPKPPVYRGGETPWIRFQGYLPG